MIKDLFELIGSFFKLIGKCLSFVFRYIGIYFKNVNDIIKDRPKKNDTKLKWNEEIL